jgi:hypothetical protein
MDVEAEGIELKMVPPRIKPGYTLELLMEKS